MKAFSSIAVTLCAVLLLFTSSQVRAVSISFNPGETSVQAGDTFFVDIMVAGLNEVGFGPFDNIVSSYSFDVDYDQALLSMFEFTPSDALGSLLPLLLDTDSGVSISLVSDLDDFTLSDNQGPSVLLGTLGFEALAEGVGTLEITNYSISGFFGIPLGISPPESGLVNIAAATGDNTDVVIPEPSALWLLLLGLGVMACTTIVVRPERFSVG